ncbi:MAG: HAD-IA family hydrolase [Nitrospiria bacterium]
MNPRTESRTVQLPVKVVFFDAAETLFRTRGSVGDIYLRIAQKYGSRASKDVIDDAFFNVFKKESPPVISKDNSPSERTVIEKKWWRAVVKQVFSKAGMVSSFDAYFEEVYAVFKGSQGWELFPDTTDVLTALKQKGYRLGMITNFDTRVYEVTGALGIGHLLDTMTLSSEAGAPKPDPAIFHKAVEAHQVKPSEALHVGDSLSDDVKGALNAGLQAVLIDRRHLFQPDEDYIKIESLTELLYYL